MLVFFFIVVCPLLVEMEGFIVYWLPRSQFPLLRRKEKASKTEKIVSWLDVVGLQPRPSCLPICVVRLKIQVSYKKITE